MKSLKKIIYISDSSPDDIGNWSGLTYFIANCLKDYFSEVFFLSGVNGWDSLPWPSKILIKLKRKFYLILNKKYHIDRDPIYVRELSKQLTIRLNNIERIESYDYIFSNSSINLCGLNVKTPTVAWLDATFGGMIDFYPSFESLCKETLYFGNYWEQKYLNSCRFAIFSSEWAANSAIEKYKINKEKVVVIPYGANLISLKPESEIFSIIDNKDMYVCNLLFIGVDWERKGGPFALEVTRILNQIGIDTVLHIVGCDPIQPPPKFVKIYGFLQKSNLDHNLKQEQLFKIAHFFILPSQAECYGLVYCEANSYGLPCFAKSVGGVPTIINNDENGYLFDVESTPYDFAEKIKEVWLDENRLKVLSKNSYNRFKAKFTWSSAGKSLNKLL